MGPFVGEIGPGLDSRIVPIQVGYELHLVSVRSPSLPEDSRYQVDAHLTVKVDIQHRLDLRQRLFGNSAQLEPVALGRRPRNIVELEVLCLGHCPGEIDPKGLGLRRGRHRCELLTQHNRAASTYGFPSRVSHQPPVVKLPRGGQGPRKALNQGV